jgi:hypothetical protein
MRRRAERGDESLLPEIRFLEGREMSFRQATDWL